MKFICPTKDSTLALSLFVSSESNVANGSPSLLLQKIHLCPFRVFLISGEGSRITPGKVPPSIEIKIQRLQETWTELIKLDLNNPANLKTVIECMDRFGKNISSGINHFGNFVYELREKADEPSYFILLPKNEGTGISRIALQAICTAWQLHQGNIPLHASGVIHKEGLYIFSGHSGAGKTSIGILGLVIGDQMLDEDQLMIFRDSGNRYSAKAWGKSLNETTIPICAFFKLMKSENNYLIPLSPLHLASFLWEQSSEVTGGLCSRQNRITLFKHIAELSREVPGYELHFRESPDVWDFLDAEICP